jgi:hypothetical protein
LPWSPLRRRDEIHMFVVIRRSKTKRVVDGSRNSFVIWMGSVRNRHPYVTRRPAKKNTKRRLDAERKTAQIRENADKKSTTFKACTEQKKETICSGTAHRWRLPTRGHVPTLKGLYETASPKLALNHGLSN